MNDQTMSIKWKLAIILCLTPIIIAVYQTDDSDYEDSDENPLLKKCSGDGCSDEKNTDSNIGNIFPSFLRDKHKRRHEDTPQGIFTLLRLLTSIIPKDEGEKTKITVNVRDIQSGFRNSGKKYHVGNIHRELMRSKREADDKKGKSITSKEVEPSSENPDVDNKNTTETVFISTFNTVSDSIEPTTPNNSTNLTIAEETFKTDFTNPTTNSDFENTNIHMSSYTMSPSEFTHFITNTTHNNSSVTHPDDNINTYSETNSESESSANVFEDKVSTLPLKNIINTESDVSVSSSKDLVSTESTTKTIDVSTTEPYDSIYRTSASYSINIASESSTLDSSLETGPDIQFNNTGTIDLETVPQETGNLTSTVKSNHDIGATSLRKRNETVNTNKQQTTLLLDVSEINTPKPNNNFVKTDPLLNATEPLKVNTFLNNLIDSHGILMNTQQNPELGEVHNDDISTNLNKDTTAIQSLLSEQQIKVINNILQNNFDINDVNSQPTATFFFKAEEPDNNVKDQTVVIVIYKCDCQENSETNYGNQQEFQINHNYQYLNKYWRTINRDKNNDSKTDSEEKNIFNNSLADFVYTCQKMFDVLDDGENNVNTSTNSSDKVKLKNDTLSLSEEEYRNSEKNQRFRNDVDTNSFINYYTKLLNMGLRSISDVSNLKRDTSRPSKFLEGIRRRRDINIKENVADLVANKLAQATILRDVLLDDFNDMIKDNFHVETKGNKHYFSSTLKVKRDLKELNDYWKYILDDNSSELKANELEFESISKEELANKAIINQFTETQSTIVPENISNLNTLSRVISDDITTAVAVKETKNNVYNYGTTIDVDDYKDEIDYGYNDYGEEVFEPQKLKVKITISLGTHKSGKIND